MYIVVDRGSDDSLDVRVDESDRTDELHIRVVDGVSSGEESRALFESGAAVQQVGADYLISWDWLRRWSGGSSERLGELMSSASNARRYIESMDAIRATVERI